MNKTDRAAIAKLIDQINLLNGQIEDVKSAVEDLQGSEREKFDNLSENLQQGERGQAIEAAANYLQEAFAQLDQSFGAMEDAVSYLENASE